MKQLRDYMRESDTDPFLLFGPPAPNSGWVYRDFRPMPRAYWEQFLALIGSDEIQTAIVNSKQQPPAELCRAQIWISPAGQLAWRNYLAGSA